MAHTILVSLMKVGYMALDNMFGIMSKFTLENGKITSWTAMALMNGQMVGNMKAIIR